MPGSYHEFPPPRHRTATGLPASGHRPATRLPTNLPLPSTPVPRPTLILRTSSCKEVRMPRDTSPFLIVEKTKMAKHETLALNGLGTPGSKTAVRSALALAGYGVSDELVGVILADWHNEVQDLAKLVPSNIFCQYPI